MMKQLLLSFCYVVLHIHAIAQQSNNDYKLGSINISLPKTPESKAFETYGSYSVSELTGSPDISFPLYTVKSKFLAVPITLRYNPGIKVNQEASWVGLGFDLIAGGRITVETKGCIDDDGQSHLLYSSTNLKYGMQKLFNRLGNANQYGILTFASTCHGCDTTVSPYTIPDDWQSAEAMGQFGVGEPDIFRANFMGHSLTFFFDKITDSLRWIGEKSLFKVILNKDAFYRITDWTITDNAGIKYFFNQKENTTLTMPPLGPLQSNSSTSAWLLTKILHPTGDSIILTYTNYGSSYTTKSWSSSISHTVYEGPALSLDAHQNTTILQPAYLTTIESNDMKVEFVLTNRTDMKGAGTKALQQIKVYDKVTNTPVKATTLTYDYFSGTLGSCYTSQPDSVKNWYRQRLKLTQFSQNSGGIHKFYYKESNIPDKLTFAQDHWGFYNSNTSGYTDPCSPKNLIPNTGISAQYGGNSILNGWASTRECSPTLMQMMTMDSIFYPTGGSTKFIYEPHPEVINSPSGGGGGLRVNTIRNYNGQNLAATVEYTYSGGMYLGNIYYNTTSYGIAACEPFNPPPAPSGIKENINAWGAVNDATDLVVYQYVKKTEKDENGRTNGYTAKTFSVTNPRYGSSGLGFDVTGAHWPTSYPHSNSTTYLYAAKSGIAPTPTHALDGKLLKEEYYDSSNNLLSSTQYYYTQADFSQKFYSIKVTDNRIGGPDAPTSGCQGIGAEFLYNGTRRFTIYVSPAKSYFTIVDSVVEKTYQGSNFITQKKTFKYNNFFQQEFATTYNSDGTQSIAYTRTPLSFIRPSVPSGGEGDAIGIEAMKTSHIYDLPIEQVNISRNINGDSVVTGAVYNVYSGSLLKKTFVLESNSLLQFRTQFVPTWYYHNYPTYGSFYVVKNSNYKLSDSAEYYSYGLIRDLTSRQDQKKAFLWDDSYNTLLAQAVNTSVGNFAFSSFETGAKGNWTYAGTPTIDHSAVSGIKAYKLSTGNISMASLAAEKTYILSYWYKTGGSVTVTGGTQISSATGKVFGAWTYKEHKFSNATSVTVSGSGSIDHLIIRPEFSMVISFVYKPLTGIQSTCDQNNVFTYYEYDEFQRLMLVRDQDETILQKLCYGLSGQSDSCKIFYNIQKSGPFTRTTCSAPDVGQQVTYVVPEGAYGSVTSQNVADSLALVDVNLNGQAYADATGSCLSPFNGINLTSVPWSITVTQVDGAFSGSYSLNPSATATLLANMPAGVYNVTLTPNFTIGSVQLTLNSTNYFGTSFSLTNITINSSNTFTLQVPCSITMASGYSSPTKGISNNGTTVTFYITFSPTSSTMLQGSTYFVATISTGCRPQADRVLPDFTTGGRTWRVTVQQNGMVLFKLMNGSTVPINTTITTPSLNYNLNN